MLIKELLFESTVSDDIVDDIMDIITAYRRKKLSIIPLKGENSLINYLKKLGYTVDTNSLIRLMQEPPFSDVVERTIPGDSIKLKTDIPDEVGDNQMEKSKETVEKSATKAANKAVKSGELG